MNHDERPSTMGVAIALAVIALILVTIALAQGGLRREAPPQSDAAAAYLANQAPALPVSREAPSLAISARSANAPTLATVLPEIVRGNATKRQAILTFDGGAGDASLPAILAALKARHIRATFFLTGRFLEAHPDDVRAIAAAGGEIFDHTYDHKDLKTLSDVEIASELARMDAALDAITGSSSKPYFRAPYGSRDARVLAAAAQAGYRSVYWTIDGLDWRAGETAPTVEARIMDGLEPGVIYLMHLGDGITGEIIGDAIDRIEAQGYRIVPLTQGI